MINPLRAITTALLTLCALLMLCALLTLCALPFGTRAGEELRFTPEHVRMERSGDDSYSATIRGELTLPAEGLLFQPSPYASDIPEQKKSRADGVIGTRGIMLQFPTPAQPLVQSSGAQDCTIDATLSHFWRYKDERIRFALTIELKDIPKSGMVKLQEQVPFILAQAVIYSETMPLKPEQMKAIKSDEIPMGELYRIKLGIKAEEDIYSTQFFDDKGEQLSVRIHKIENDAEGKVEIECAFLFGTPSSFRTVKLQEPRPISLPLNATLKLLAAQIDRAIQQSLGGNSPYQIQWTGIDFNLSPDAAQYSNSLNLTWELSGFNGSPRPDPIWIDSQEERPLEHSSALNGCTTKLNQSSMNEKQQFRLCLPQPLSGKQLHFDETLSFKTFKGSKTSKPLNLNATQSSTHSVNGQEFTVIPDSLGKHQGFRIMGLESNDSITKITFINAKGDSIAQSSTSYGGGREGVFFFGFQGQQPAAFQIEYQTKAKPHSIPCRFTIPLPEWVETKTLHSPAR